MSILSSAIGPIIKTKISIPPPGSNLISRQNIYSILNDLQKSQIVIIAAPAGYGKTILLSEWANRSERPIAWVTLDKNDNNPKTFLTYISQSLKKSFSEFDEELSRFPAPLQNENYQVYLAALINNYAEYLKERKTERPCLILDDFHLIEDKAIHQAVNYLLDNLPQNIQVIISGRTFPPLAISRFRSKRRLTEISTNDLMLTFDEIEYFLVTTMGVKLSKKEILLLEKRTEGWITGVQLAALSIKKHSNIKKFFQDFTKSNRFILDYLVDEVLQNQPEIIQNFLMLVSNIENFSKDLCDNLWESDWFGENLLSSKQVLDYLEENNLFILPLDDKREWYRLHTLFSEILQQKFLAQYPHLHKKIHIKTCKWFKENGMVFEALNHALLAGDFGEAASIIEQTDPANMVLRGEVKIILDWIVSLPEDILFSRPRLLLTYCWALFLNSEIDRIEPYLQKAEELLQAHILSEEPERKEFSGEINAIRAWIALDYYKNMEKAISLANEALILLPENYSLMKSALFSILGDSYQRIDQIDKACTAYIEAIRISSAGKYILPEMVYKNDLARLQTKQGRLQMAAILFQEILEMGSFSRIPNFPVARAYIGYADILREWNEIEQAEIYANEGIKLSQTCGYLPSLVIGKVVMAKIKFAQNKRIQSAKLFNEAIVLAEETKMVRFVEQVSAFQANYGNQKIRRDWLKSCGLSENDRLGYDREVEYLSFIKLQNEQLRGKPDRKKSLALLELINHLLMLAEDGQRNGSIIHLLIQKSLTLFNLTQSSKKEAVQIITDVLLMAEAENYLRVFLDEGQPMANLLLFALNQNSNMPYASRLLKLFKDSEINAAPQQDNLPEPISERELDVLHLLAEGFSNKEISSRLHISMSTVNTHTTNIYQKLSVRNRVQAVIRAKENNLL